MSQTAEDADVVLRLTRRQLSSKIGGRDSAEALARRLVAVAIDLDTPPQNVLKCAVATLVVIHDWGLSGLGMSHSMIGYWRAPEATWASFDAIRWALSRGAYTEDSLDEMAAILEALHSRPTSTRGVRLCAAEWVAWDAGWSPTDYMVTNFSPNRFPEAVRVGQEAAEAIVASWNLPASQIPKSSETATRRFEKEFNPWMQAYEWLGPRMRAVVDLELARSAVAIARFTAATGHNPSSLADCVPQFLPSLTTDRPMRVKGNRVWDVGPNDIDDGGEPGKVSPWGRTWRFSWEVGAPQGDLTWEVNSSIVSNLASPISKADLIGEFDLDCEAGPLKYADYLRVRDDGELFIPAREGGTAGREQSIGHVKDAAPLSLRMMDDDWTLRRDPDGFVAKSTKGEEIWLVRGDAEYYER